jgi:hypothetical protein
MDWTALSAMAEILGAAAVVVSVLYLAQQIRHNTRQVRLAAQQATVHELGNALRTQAQNREWSELLSRGLNDLESLDAIERTQFLTHVGQILRLYESAYLHHLEGTLDPRFWGGFERAMADIVDYPGMRAAFRIRRHHFSQEFGQFVDRLQPLTPLKVFGELDHLTDSEAVPK